MSMWLETCAKTVNNARIEVNVFVVVVVVVVVVIIVIVVMLLLLFLLLLLSHYDLCVCTTIHFKIQLCVMLCHASALFSVWMGVGFFYFY